LLGAEKFNFAYSLLFSLERGPERENK